MNLDPTLDTRRPTAACGFVETLFASTLAATCISATLDEVLPSQFFKAVAAWCVCGWGWSGILLVAIAWLEFLVHVTRSSSGYRLTDVKIRFPHGKEI
jgi:hypothetical protein